MTVLVDKLMFANGVALSPAEDFIVVSDLGRSRLLRVWLKDGQVEVFADGLPGVGDNLTADKKGFWVALPLAIDPENPSIIHSFASKPYLRKMMARMFSLVELLMDGIEKVYPNTYSKSFKGIPKATTSSYIPPRCTVLRFDWDGKIIAAYHSFEHGSYTHVMELDGFLYLGSFTNNFIAKVARQNHL